MKCCPILSFQADRFCEVGCREERCAFADENVRLRPMELVSVLLNKHSNSMWQRSALELLKRKKNSPKK